MAATYTDAVLRLAEHGVHPDSITFMMGRRGSIVALARKDHQHLTVEELTVERCMIKLLKLARQR